MFKKILLILLLIPVRICAGPLTSIFDLEHDLMHIGAGCLVAGATHGILRLAEHFDHVKLNPWVKVGIEIGMDLGVQCLYQAAANNKSSGQQTERVLAGTIGVIPISIEFNF